METTGKTHRQGRGSDLEDWECVQDGDGLPAGNPEGGILHVPI